MKSLLLALPLTLLASAALADTLEILYPRTACTTIVGTDLSAPGGDSARYLFEMLCKDEAGQHRVFVTSWATTTAFFGFSRAGVPTTLLLTPANVPTLQVVD
jgi:hypothetical protein